LTTNRHLDVDIHVLINFSKNEVPLLLSCKTLAILTVRTK